MPRGFVTQKDPQVFRFIDRVYSMPGIKADFDAVAQHPYAETMDKMRFWRGWFGGDDEKKKEEEKKKKAELK